MKFLILVPDGCADWKIPALDGKTPLEAAGIDNINALAKKSEIGLARTIPEGVEPGSDAANLSILGFDPSDCLTGRAPLEAIAAGIKLSVDDIAFRANFVTLRAENENDSYDDLIIESHSAGEITEEESAELIAFLNEKLATDDIRFYTGISYRCAMVTEKFGAGCELRAPHDFLTQKTRDALPTGIGAEKIETLMRRSYEILKNHPINLKRREKNLLPANAIWFWGQGKKPNLPSFREKFGVDGSVITAVNLIRGIGICLGLSVTDVPGANGTVNTNYEGKARAAIDEFSRGKDFVFLHFEAPDECSHGGNLSDKLRSLKHFDDKIFAPIHEFLAGCGEPFRILIISDHFTPLEIRRHTDEPVPFVLFDSEKILPHDDSKFFSEASAKNGKFFSDGVEIAEYFFRRT
ncbi:MAG: cofactor-independent phosphoglycerate mutase [Defluviitaleaceae bacterium]|nr:cofactor-independent phosphoglycerate mutase [Defluviitaleaceae bacterium]